MTTPTDKASEAPGSRLSAPEGHEPPVAGTTRHPGGLRGAQTVAQRLDAPGWYASPAVGHWMPPDRCLHPDDRVLGPCDCRA